MCYYVIIGVVLMTGYTFFITNNDRTLESFKSYFSCHSVGVQLGIDCGEPPEDLFLILTSVSAILIGLFPVIILIYSADCIHCIVYHRGGKSNPETESWCYYSLHAGCHDTTIAGCFCEVDYLVKCMFAVLQREQNFSVSFNFIILSFQCTNNKVKSLHFYGFSHGELLLYTK